MKIKKIIDVCKKRKSIRLFYVGRSQWISDGIAAFPLLGCPEFDEESLCRTFDIAEKAADKISFELSDHPPKGYCFADTEVAETVCERDSIGITFSRTGAVPYKTETGILFMDAAYLSPFEDQPEGVEVFLRHTKEGQPYFAVKLGFMLSGIVMPMEVISEEFVEELSAILTKCRAALENQSRL